MSIKSTTILVVEEITEIYNSMYIYPMFLRLLLYMYTHQKLRVKWNGICSELFDVTNGGILSLIIL